MREMGRKRAEKVRGVQEQGVKGMWVLLNVLLCFVEQDDLQKFLSIIFRGDYFHL